MVLLNSGLAADPGVGDRPPPGGRELLIAVLLGLVQAAVAMRVLVGPRVRHTSCAVTRKEQERIDA